MEAAQAHAKVLVVDDDPSILYLVTETLREVGYDCLPVENGRAALSVIDSWQPDGIILDIMLPRVDGVEVVKLLRSMCRRCGLPMPRIMIMTAGFKASEIARDLGVKHWIGKPFMLNELFAKTAVMLADEPPPLEKK